jgi:hypothetical protein
MQPPIDKSKSKKKSTSSNASKVLTKKTNNKSGSGYWTEEEHFRFLEAIKKFPQGPWNKIAEHVGTRTTRQTVTHMEKIRQRWDRQAKGLRSRRRLPTKMIMKEQCYLPFLEQFVETNVLPNCLKQNSEREGKKRQKGLNEFVSAPTQLQTEESTRKEEKKLSVQMRNGDIEDQDEDNDWRINMNAINPKSVHHLLQVPAPLPFYTDRYYHQQQQQHLYSPPSLWSFASIAPFPSFSCEEISEVLELLCTPITARK